MKRKSILFLVVLMLLCAVTTAFGKGTLADLDGFETYIGKSKTEVRSIARIFEEFSESQYIVDIIDADDSGFIALSVIFDDSNYVESVAVLLTDGALEELDVSSGLQSAAVIGLLSLGFQTDDMVDHETNEDGQIIMLFPNAICMASELSDGFYAILAMDLPE